MIKYINISVIWIKINCLVINSGSGLLPNEFQNSLYFWRFLSCVSIIKDPGLSLPFKYTALSARLEPPAFLSHQPSNSQVFFSQGRIHWASRGSSRPPVSLPFPPQPTRKSNCPNPKEELYIWTRKTYWAAIQRVLFPPKHFHSLGAFVPSAQGV